MPALAPGLTLGRLLAPHDPDAAWRRALASARAAVAPPARPLSLRAWITQTDPRFVWYDHCERLVEVLQRVVEGELRRLIIAEPPRHGKSELVSRKLPAYFLYRFPDRFAALTSYAAELAYTLSRNARDHYTRGGGQLRDDAAAVKHWETGGGGGLWAAGFGGPATGKGFHLGIIDDPIKNAEEAASATIGARNWDWYRSTFYTRAEPDAAIIIMQTRWPGPGDLIGRVLEAEEDDEPERWHVVLFEAIKEPTAIALPATCTLEPDPRPAGAALCPERYPVERLRAIEQRIRPFYFTALFQQRPRARDGGMFPRTAATVVPAAPAHVERRVRWWDYAATEGGGDWSVGVRMSVAAGVYYVEDVVRVQLGPAKRDALVLQSATLDGRDVEQGREQEPGSAGKDAAERFVRDLAGWPVHTEPASGSKELRADPFAAQWQAGNVRLVAGPWNRAYLDELEAFPTGKHDDQVDGSSGAFKRLTTAGRATSGGRVVTF